jgi:hypothetical protein
MPDQKVMSMVVKLNFVTEDVKKFVTKSTMALMGNEYYSPTALTSTTWIAEGKDNNESAKRMAACTRASMMIRAAVDNSDLTGESFHFDSEWRDATEPKVLLDILIQRQNEVRAENLGLNMRKLWSLLCDPG